MQNLHNFLSRLHRWWWVRPMLSIDTMTTITTACVSGNNEFIMIFTNERIDCEYVNCKLVFTLYSAVFFAKYPNGIVRLGDIVWLERATILP